MYVSQVINGIVLPVVLIFILLLVNDPKLMADQTNGPIFNAVAWATAATMILLTVVLLGQSL
jgi:Mn2+/Fe2+ NRAMP family transporter